MNSQSTNQMHPETVAALFEMMRCAIRTVTRQEPTGPIVITLHADREDEWAAIADRETVQTGLPGQTTVRIHA